MNARAIELMAALRSLSRTLLGSGGIGFYLPIDQDLVQIDAVTGRADALMAALRELVRTMPGIVGIGFYGFVTCDLVQLTAATDADVFVWRQALELDIYEIRIGNGVGRGRWWLRAASEAQGDWIDLAGPHHQGSPPDTGASMGPVDGTSSRDGLRSPQRGGTMPADGQPLRGMGD